jgi:hypothetical protein
VNIGDESLSMPVGFNARRRSKSRKPNETGVPYKFSLRAQLSGERRCASMVEANEFLGASFREMFPEHGAPADAA